MRADDGRSRSGGGQGGRRRRWRRAATRSRSRSCTGRATTTGRCRRASSTRARAGRTARCARSRRRPGCAAALGEELDADHLPRPQGPRQGRPLLADGAESTASFAPNDEVDELRWLAPAEARASCSATRTTPSSCASGRAPRMNRERFPGLADGWARLDGPAGTQMVDSAIEAMADWMRSGRNANHGGAVRRRARHRRARRDRARERRRAARRRPARRSSSARADRADDALRRRRRRARCGRATRSSARASTTTPTSRPWVIHAERDGATVRFAEPEPGHARAARERGRGGPHRPHALGRGHRTPPTRSARSRTCPGSSPPPTPPARASTSTRSTRRRTAGSTSPRSAATRSPARPTSGSGRTSAILCGAARAARRS